MKSAGVCTYTYDRASLLHYRITGFDAVALPGRGTTSQHPNVLASIDKLVLSAFLTLPPFGVYLCKFVHPELHSYSMREFLNNPMSLVRCFQAESLDSFKIIG